jgi:hypothetical protein
MPTPLWLSRERLRLFYCTRDKGNRSHIFYSDHEPRPPWKILDRSNGPVFSPGKLGEFDSHGVMPTAIRRNGDDIWLYYIGWTVREDVPYHNAIGLASSRDGGRTFDRVVPGPVVSTGPFEPYFCGTAEIATLKNRWIMWYMSATEWRVVDGKPEPRYHLKQAFSDDGIRWRPEGAVAIDYLSNDEGGIARATVMHEGDDYWMWFCYRGIADYRGSGRQAYRLGVAWSPDAMAWKRLPYAQVFTTPAVAADFDARMECYPAIFNGPTGTYLFYNGSDFGQTGIGFAERFGALRG